MHSLNLSGLADPTSSGSEAADDVTKLIQDYVNQHDSSSQRLTGLIISGYPRSSADLWHYLDHIGRVDGVILLNWREENVQAQIDYGASQGQVELESARREWNQFKKYVIPLAEFFDLKQLLYVVSR